MNLIYLAEQHINHKTAINIVARYCMAFDAADMEVVSKLSSSVELLLQDPSFTYNGVMFRALAYPNNINNLNSLTDYIRSYDNQSSQKYRSWSKSTKGMMNAIANNIESGVSDFNNLVILTQHGNALDVGAVMKSDNRYWNEYEDLADEQELLAKTNNSLSIFGFYNENQNQFFSTSQFEQFLMSNNA